MWLFLTFLAFLAVNGDNSTGRTDILLILEHPKLLSVNEEKSSLDISFELCFEWETKRTKESKYRELTNWNELDSFGIISENSQSLHTSKSIVNWDTQLQHVRSGRSVSVKSESALDYSAFPNDAHLFQLRFTSITRNASQLTLNPHFVSAAQNLSYSQWHFEASKAYVQWVVHKNESFEQAGQAVFEFRITRRPYPSLRISLFLVFLVNVAMIFDYFPVSRMLQSSSSSGFFLCCGLVISSVATCQGPSSGTLTSFDYQLISLLLLGVLVEILHQLLPFFVFHLRCCPIESDPCPPMFPSPSDQFSLDTERSKCHAALDSARAESVRSPRIANFDMCLAEVKFTMTNFNEVLNLHSSAQWRRKLWYNAYRRFEILAFIVLQIINCIFLLAFCQ